jgi:hypothetical protein
MTNRDDATYEDNDVGAGGGALRSPVVGMVVDGDAREMKCQW